MPGAVIASPFPFPTHEAMTHVVVCQEQDTEDQRPIPATLYDGLVVYDGRSEIIYGKDSKQISLSGMFIVHGDVQALDGKAAFQDSIQISKEKKQVYAARKSKLLSVIYSTEAGLL